MWLQLKKQKAIYAYYRSWGTKQLADTIVAEKSNKKMFFVSWKQLNFFLSVLSCFRFVHFALLNKEKSIFLPPKRNNTFFRSYACVSISTFFHFFIFSFCKYTHVNFDVSSYYFPRSSLYFRTLESCRNYAPRMKIIEWKIERADRHLI